MTLLLIDLYYLTWVLPLITALTTGVVLHDSMCSHCMVFCIDDGDHNAEARKHKTTIKKNKRWPVALGEVGAPISVSSRGGESASH